MSVEELEAAVTRLSSQDRSRFLAWVDAYCGSDDVLVDALGHALADRRRGEILVESFGAWRANATDFEALRSEADHR